MVELVKYARDHSKKILLLEALAVTLDIISKFEAGNEYYELKL